MLVFWDHYNAWLLKWKLSTFRFYAFLEFCLELNVKWIWSSWEKNILMFHDRNIEFETLINWKMKVQSIVNLDVPSEFCMQVLHYFLWSEQLTRFSYLGCIRELFTINNIYINYTIPRTTLCTTPCITKKS